MKTWDRVVELTKAIAKFEGFDPNGKSTNIPTRNMNPGNLEYNSKFVKNGGYDAVAGDPERYAKFPDYNTGLKALSDNICFKAKRGLTFIEMMIIYAPPPENDTEKYTAFIISQIGVKNKNVKVIDYLEKGILE